MLVLHVVGLVSVVIELYNLFSDELRWVSFASNGFNSDGATLPFLVAR